MWMVSYLQWASLKPSSHSASLLWELVSISSYWQLSSSIDFSHGSYQLWESFAANESVVIAHCIHLRFILTRLQVLPSTISCISTLYLLPSASFLYCKHVLIIQFSIAAFCPHKVTNQGKMTCFPCTLQCKHTILITVLASPFAIR